MLSLPTPREGEGGPGPSPSSSRLAWNRPPAREAHSSAGRRGLRSPSPGGARHPDCVRGGRVGARPASVPARPLLGAGWRRGPSRPGTPPPRGARRYQPRPRSEGRQRPRAARGWGPRGPRRRPDRAQRSAGLAKPEAPETSGEPWGEPEPLGAGARGLLLWEGRPHTPLGAPSPHTASPPRQGQESKGVNNSQSSGALARQQPTPPENAAPLPLSACRPRPVPAQCHLGL